MMRITEKTDQNQYIVANEKITQEAEGYSGEAIEKLAKFENLYDDLVASQDLITKELVELRSQGKEKSVKFRELLGKKLLNNSILIQMKGYGLSY